MGAPAAATAIAQPAQAGPADEARRLYAAFVEAQNAHDFAALRALLIEGPRFLG